MFRIRSYPSLEIAKKAVNQSLRFRNYTIVESSKVVKGIRGWTEKRKTKTTWEKRKPKITTLMRIKLASSVNREARALQLAKIHTYEYIYLFHMSTRRTSTRARTRTRIIENAKKIVEK